MTQQLGRPHNWIHPTTGLWLKLFLKRKMKENKKLQTSQENDY